MKILASYNITEKTNLETLLSNIDANSNYTGDATICAEVLKEHTTDSNIHWVYRDHLENTQIVNGGSAANTILINDGLSNNDFIELEKTEQELKDEGYLPVQEKTSNE
jgi:hypothetical protein